MKRPERAVKRLFPLLKVKDELPPERRAGVAPVEVQKGIRLEVSAEEVATLPDPPPPPELEGQVVRQVSAVRHTWSVIKLFQALVEGVVVPR